MYIISKVTLYDSDQELWETKVGKDNANKDLTYSCWGKNKEESRDRAYNLVALLNKSGVNAIP